MDKKLQGTHKKLKTYKNLWEKLYAFENLQNAYWKAKKHKSSNPKIVTFDKNWRLNLCILIRELRTKTYKPFPLKKFILRDPKTRVICVSEFRDRIVHHALINILRPIFEPKFIFDSYASRKGKGTLAAIKRFDLFKRKISKNNFKKCFVLKADIYHYFDTVDHEKLLIMIKKYIKDECVIELIRLILENYQISKNKGMPLGNWTSQFFANIYLNELDQFIKHKLKVKYYIRYVDDFIIFHNSYEILKFYKKEIETFLLVLKLQLHPDKCKIIPLKKGIKFLGFRIFYYHKLIIKRNFKKIQTKISTLTEEYKNNLTSIENIFNVFHGWKAYAMQGNTYKLREKIQKNLMGALQK